MEQAPDTQIDDISKSFLLNDKSATDLLAFDDNSARAEKEIVFADAKVANRSLKSKTGL